MSALPPSKNWIHKLWAGLGRSLYVLTWPALYIYVRRGGERTRLIVTAEDKILLVKDWLGDGSWKLPGGGLHKGEDAAAGALRELAEETGLSAQVSKLQPLGRIELRGHGIPVTLRCFGLKLSSATTPRAQHLEILDAQWLPLSEVIDKHYISDNTRELIVRWRNQL